MCTHSFSDVVAIITVCPCCDHVKHLCVIYCERNAVTVLTQLPLHLHRCDTVSFLFSMLLVPYLS